MKLILIFTMVLLFITGCSEEIIPVENDSKKFSNVEMPPETPKGFLVINNDKTQMKSGNYRWRWTEGFNSREITTDAASPNQIASTLSPIQTSSHSAIIEIEQKPSLKAFLWTEDGTSKEIPLEQNKLSLPSKGKYIYEILATWENGEVSYTFVVETN